ncbi:MAG TPA: response regulator [Magnetospirillaceae bacterium]|jgi:CheY-like chemotaxis protein
MINTSYKGVRMALADADPVFSKVLSDAFLALGLSEVATCADKDQLLSALSTPADIIACSIDLPGIDFLKLAQDIRHGRVGANPFAVLIATGNPNDPDAISRILSAGVDDLVIKPAEADSVVRRITAFTKERKPFVVSNGYVGPSRRPARRGDGSEDDIVEVPNTLRAKVVLGRDGPDLKVLMDAGFASLTQRKAQSGVRLMARLTRRVRELAPDAAQIEETRRILWTLGVKAAEVVVENKISKTTRLVAEVAERVAKLSRRAAETQPRPRRAEVELLVQLAETSVATFLSMEGSTKTVPEMIAIVDAHLAPVSDAAGAAPAGPPA